MQSSGLRVPEDHEIQGLDITQHGEEGYDWEHPVPVAVAAFLPGSETTVRILRQARRDTQAAMGD